MPVITVDIDDLASLLGTPVEKEMLLEQIPMLGADIERVDGSELSIEFFPDRPDLLSVEGLARALRSFLDIQPGMTRYELAEPGIELHVDGSVKNVRPYIAGAVIRDIRMSEVLVASLMEMQEKLHLSVGKERSKMAIGIHNLDAVTPPFTYKAAEPHEVSFIPLGTAREMDLAGILRSHEKGKKYAHLLEGCERYPVIFDRHDNVLSFPPIINGELTVVDLFTENLFIDVTGTERKPVTTALTVIAAALAERGGSLEQVTVVDGEATATPGFTPGEHEVSLEAVSRLLGRDMAGSVVDAARRMGYDARLDGGVLHVSVPPWRTDILHDVDVIEDIAIGYGYNAFTASMPRSMTYGGGISHDALHETMVGLGFNEVATLSLSGVEEQFERMRLPPGEHVTIGNPISSKHALVRVSLLPSLLEILSKNRHHDLPQQIYEVGDIVEMDDGPCNRLMLAGVKIAAKTGFTECKSIVQAILSNLGIDPAVESHGHPSFTGGRCAAVVHDGRRLGYYGEIHPGVITAFDLEYPVIAFELSVEALTAASQHQ
ncbi:MAG: phenylalanine--tRNA ligase subunit beta [Thermoplasmatota archaeon]